MAQNNSPMTLPFATRPMALGRIAAVVGLAIVAIASFVVSPGELREGSRIAGLALVLVGGLAFGFGRLLASANKSPRENGPVA